MGISYFGKFYGPAYSAARFRDAFFGMPKSRHTDRYERLLSALRQCRLDAELTQTQVAKHFGAHASFVSKVESGERRLDVVELADFCRLYGVRLASFLKQTGLD